MFKKLRNKLILINLGITTLVIFAAFSMIYLITTHNANNRPPLPDTMLNLYTDEMEDAINISIKNEKQAAANNLLIMLITSGIAIEIAVAIISFIMADEAIKPVREAYESQKIFIANASHEIKTPLAAISANLEAADITDNKWIKNVEKEAAKLAALNSELLTLARTDLMTDSQVTETNLKSKVENTLESFEPRLKNKKFIKNIDLPTNIKIASDDFIQILSILMDNAIKYSNQKVSVRATQHELVVENDGKTISQDAINHIFDRFYQQDKTAEGVGLGLSIAKSLADRNHWKITVTSNKITKFKLEY